jgi:hypothetical protein
MGLVSPSDQDRRRRTKNIGLAVLLLALAGLFYLITIVKLTGNVS